MSSPVSEVSELSDFLLLADINPLGKVTTVPHRIIRSWYTGSWRRVVQRGRYLAGPQLAPCRLFLAVPSVTVHPSSASVPITVLLYNGPLLCDYNVPIKGLTLNRRVTTHGSHLEQRCADVWSENEQAVPDLRWHVWIVVEQHHGTRHRHDERNELRTDIKTLLTHLHRVWMSLSSCLHRQHKQRRHNNRIYKSFNVSSCLQHISRLCVRVQVTGLNMASFNNNMLICYRPSDRVKTDRQDIFN